MEVRCPSCDAKYVVSDDKVRGRRGRFPCRRCGTKVDLDGTKLGAPPEASPPAASPARIPAKPPVPTRSLEVGAVPTWSVAVTGQEPRPMPVSVIALAFRAKTIDRTTYVWLPGMPDWVPLADAADLVRALKPHGIEVESAPAPAGPRDEPRGLGDEDEATRLHTAAAGLGSVMHAQPPPVIAMDEEEATQMVSLADHPGLPTSSRSPARTPPSGPKASSGAMPPSQVKPPSEAKPPSVARLPPVPKLPPRPAMDEDEATRLLTLPGAPTPGLPSGPTPLADEDEATRFSALTDAPAPSLPSGPAGANDEAAPRAPEAPPAALPESPPPDAGASAPAVAAPAVDAAEVPPRPSPEGAVLSREATGQTRVVRVPQQKKTGRSVLWVVILMAFAGLCGHLLSRLTNARSEAPPRAPASALPAVTASGVPRP